MKSQLRAFRAPVLALALAFAAPPAFLGAPSARAQEGEDEPSEPQGVLRELAAMNQKGVELLQSKKYDEGIAEFKKMIETLEKAKDVKAEIAREYKRLATYNLACAYSLKKDTKEALDWFEKSVDAGFWDWRHIDKDSDLDAVRGEARFKEIVVKGKELQKTRAKENASTLISKDALYDYPLSLKSVKGERVKLETSRGKVVIVDIFADMEGPDGSRRGGVAETEDLAKLWQAQKEKGLEVVGLMFVRGAEGDEARDQVKETVEKSSIPYPVGWASEKQLKKAWGDKGQALPLTLFIDRAGKLRARVAGGDRNIEQIKAIADILLAEKAPEGPAPKGGDEKKDDEKKDGDKKDGDKKDEKKEKKEEKKEPKKDEPLQR